MTEYERSLIRKYENRNVFRKPISIEKYVISFQFFNRFRKLSFHSSYIRGHKSKAWVIMLHSNIGVKNYASPLFGRLPALLSRIEMN